MSTRGFIGFVAGAKTSIAYNHSDSYPDYLGHQMLNPCLIVAGILDVRDARRRRAIRARASVAPSRRTPISEHKDAE